MRVTANWAGGSSAAPRLAYEETAVEQRFDRQRPRPTRAKRIIDVTVAGTALLVTLPFLALTWGLVRLTSPGPGIFWSQRVGLNGQRFWMPKFRTMTVGSRVISREAAREGDVNLTPIGNFLRKASIDELPQLWSVLVGHMSLIGPRALIPDDIANEARSRYNEIYMIRPGISGLAQIKGRNLVTPRKKALYDRFYAMNSTVRVDFWIIGQTIKILWDTKLIK